MSNNSVHLTLLIKLVVLKKAIVLKDMNKSLMNYVKFFGYMYGLPEHVMKILK